MNNVDIQENRWNVQFPIKIQWNKASFDRPARLTGTIYVEQREKKEPIENFVHSNQSSNGYFSISQLIPAILAILIVFIEVVVAIDSFSCAKLALKAIQFESFLPRYHRKRSKYARNGLALLFNNYLMRFLIHKCIKYERRCNIIIE